MFNFNFNNSMKKVYNLLASALLFVAGVAGASARHWTYDSTTSVGAADIAPNTPYVFQTGFSVAAGSETYFLSGQKFTTSINLTLDNLYKFVQTGEQNTQGETVYYIQRVTPDGAPAEYLAEPKNGQFYTQQLERAWKIVVKTAVKHQADYSYGRQGKTADGLNDSTINETGIQAYIWEAKETSQTLDLAAVSFNAQADNGAVIIASAEPKSKEPFSEYDFLLTYPADNKGANAAKATDYNRNAWVIYPASMQDAFTSLSEVIKEILGEEDLETKLQNYVRGNTSGRYSQEKYDALKALWDKFETIKANQSSATEAEMDALAEAFPKAYDEFVNSGVPLVEGYYIFTNWRGADSNKNPDNGQHAGKHYDDGALFDASAVDPTDLRLRWTYEGKTKFAGSDEAVTYDDQAPLDYKAAKFVWHVTPDPDNADLFFFRNLQTDNYIGTQGSLYQPIVMTKNPEVSYTIKVNPNSPGFFSFYSPTLVKSPGAEFSGVHTAGDATNVVPWDWKTPGSSWHVRAISDTELAALRAQMEQPKRNADMAALVRQSESAIANGYSYAGFDTATGQKIPASTTGDIASPVDGLVTDASQLACPMNDVDEGQNIGTFLDNNSNTYFHSTWHGGDNAWLGDHYLQMTLPQAENELLIKWAKRIHNKNAALSKGAPLKVVLWGTNDAAALDKTKEKKTNAEGTEYWDYNAWKTAGWDSIAVGEFKYPYEIQVTETTNTKIQNAVGYGYFKYTTPYKYIRMAVISRAEGNDRPGGGNVYFHGSELRVYRGGYDAATSLIDAVPQAVVDKLKAEITKAKKEVEDKLATAATLASLKAAYDEFMKNYPDPTRVTSLVAEAKAIHAAAEENDAEIGYYKSGSKTALQTVITKVENDLAAITATRQPKVDEVNNFLSQLNAGLDAFAASLNMPAAGYYFIKSNTSNESLVGTTIVANNSSRKEPVMLSGRKKNAANKYEDDGIIQEKLGAFWYVEKVTDGYTYKNLFTGLYLAPVKGQEVVAQSTTPYVFNVRFAKTPGCFNFVIDKKDASGSNIYVNAQPSSNKLVTWNTAEGRDNSAFRFEAADPTSLLTSGFIYMLQHQTGAQIVTFPVDVETSKGKFYTVIGQSAADNSIKLKEAAKAQAGKAYVYIPESGNTADFVRFYTSAQTLTDFAPTSVEAAAENGLVPTFETVKISQESGKFNTDHSMVLRSEQDETVKANTGYFTQMPATTEAGDASIAANGTITLIQNAVITDTAAKQGIYTISGVRLNSAKNLPAGVYIVNGKKQVVK